TEVFVFNGRSAFAVAPMRDVEKRAFAACQIERFGAQRPSGSTGERLHASEEGRTGARAPGVVPACQFERVVYRQRRFRACVGGRVADHPVRASFVALPSRLLLVHAAAAARAVPLCAAYPEAPNFLAPTTRAECFHELRSSDRDHVW